VRDARVPARHAAVEATADEATTDEAAAAALAEELVAMRATRRAAFAARDVRHYIRAFEALLPRVRATFAPPTYDTPIAGLNARCATRPPGRRVRVSEL